MRLLDDDFMTKVFEDVECSEVLLQILPEIYIIFITEKDVLKSDLPIYHIDRVIEETKELFNGETHII